jgi:hypothetical protein
MPTAYPASWSGLSSSLYTGYSSVQFLQDVQYGGQFGENRLQSIVYIIDGMAKTFPEPPEFLHKGTCYPSIKGNYTGTAPILNLPWPRPLCYPPWV